VRFTKEWKGRCGMPDHSDTIATGLPSASSPLRATAQRTRHLIADPAVSAVAAVGLIVVGVIHALEIQRQLSGTVWLTAGFCLLAVVAPAAGVWLVLGPTVLAWLFGGLLCLFTATGYCLTRGVGMPGDPADVGNWLEPLGVAALITEGTVVILAVLALVSHYRDARGPTDSAATPPDQPSPDCGCRNK
jgi:hypothetical protein